MNSVVIFEAIRTLLLALMVAFLVRNHMVHRDETNIAGWRLILSGFVLLLLASLLDVTDNFPQLNKWVFLGDTPQMAFLEEFVGYGGGFLLLVIGLLRWMPSVQALQQEVTARQQAQQLIEEQKDFLQTVIDGIPDPMVVINLNYRVLLQNRASKVLLPDNEQSSAELTCHWLSHRSPQPCDLDHEDCPLREVLHSGTTVTVVHRHLDAEGEPQIVELTASPFHNSQGELVGIIESARDISDRVHLEHRLQKNEKHLRLLTWHDPLTGLYNRDYFIRRLKMALQVTQHLAVLVIDIDCFKRLNEGLGHIAGDEILSELATRLSTGLRSNDVLARSGDEFLLLTRHRVTTERTSQLARKILAAVGAKLEVAGQIIYPHASIGIAQFPEDGSEVDSLLSHADTAAHRALEAGGHRLHHYSMQESTQVQEQLLLEAGLREAIEQDQLVVYYQPQVDLNSARIIGAEALVRWQHPQFGLVPPGKFISLAEASELIVELGACVLLAACGQAARWYDSGHLTGRIAVNLSARQFDEEDLAAKILAVLEQTGCPPEALELEVTESMIMLNSDKVAFCLQQLRKQGIKVAMDDFGTGYSSMLQLHRLPIDKIKIDQSFVRNLLDDTDAATITRSIIALATSLNLDLIAEGIEAQPQADFLQAAGCLEGQGFLYSPAIPAQDFTALLLQGGQFPGAAAIVD